jgi:hypothetical protein
MIFDWRRILRLVAFVASLFIAWAALDRTLNVLLPLGLLEPLVRKFGPVSASRGVAVLCVALAIGFAMGAWSTVSKLLGLPSYDPPR